MLLRAQSGGARIGFRNRLLVMFQWAYAYLTYRRGARLITGGSRN